MTGPDRTPARALVACVLAGLALSACGGEKDDHSDTDTHGTDATGTGTGTGGATGTGSDCVEENGACVLEGTYTEDLVLTADKPWLLRSAVIIGDDTNPTTLTIRAGTQIYGESATNGFLVISRSARIVAEGTAEAPILFTSDQAEGTRARGDWGGVVINGRAPINACTEGTTPCEAEGEGGTGTYGGSDPTDDSGSMSYVVIEYGGTEISPDNEINGLGLQGVGSGTTLDHIQIHRNLDDGIEFWGGNVSVKYLVVSSPGDDAIDWDLGWQGNIQFAVVQQGTDAGNNGFEADNHETDHQAEPISSPTVSNITLIGSEEVAEDNYGMLFRRGTTPTVRNLAVAGFSSACLAVRDQATFDAFADGTASIKNTALACAAPFEVNPTEETEIGTEEEVFADASNHELDDLELTDATSTTAPDFRPKAGSPLLGAGEAPSDAWFDAATFIGGMGADDDWTAGWTRWAAN